jgi:hypothetical protein
MVLAPVTPRKGQSYRGFAQKGHLGLRHFTRKMFRGIASLRAIPTSPCLVAIAF